MDDFDDRTEALERRVAALEDRLRIIRELATSPALKARADIYGIATEALGLKGQDNG